MFTKWWIVVCVILLVPINAYGIGSYIDSYCWYGVTYHLDGDNSYMTCLTKAEHDEMFTGEFWDDLKEKNKFFDYLDTVEKFKEANVFPPLYIPDGFCQDVDMFEPCPEWDGWEKYDNWRDEYYEMLQLQRMEREN